MAITVTEIEENGIPYRITQDPEKGLYIKESLQAPPPPPSDPLALLEEENALLALELVQTQLRLDQVEQEQADLLLLLVSEEVI